MNNAICPSCNTEFECKANTFEACWCTTIDLNKDERLYLKNNYEGCLCSKCIHDIKNKLQAELNVEFKENDIIE